MSELKIGPKYIKKIANAAIKDIPVVFYTNPKTKTYKLNHSNFLEKNIKIALRFVNNLSIKDMGQFKNKKEYAQGLIQQYFAFYLRACNEICQIQAKEIEDEKPISLTSNRFSNLISFESYKTYKIRSMKIAKEMVDKMAKEAIDQEIEPNDESEFIVEPIITD